MHPFEMHKLWGPYRTAKEAFEKSPYDPSEDLEALADTLEALVPDYSKDDTWQGHFTTVCLLEIIQEEKQEKRKIDNIKNRYFKRGFLGTSVFGDSYQMGSIPILLTHFERLVPTNMGRT